MINNQQILVTKASGLPDVYSEEKLRRSLTKSGADEQMIETILRKVRSKLYNGIPTRKIYETAFQLLKKVPGSKAGRYNLKRAIMDLGPSGFPLNN